MTTMAQCQPRPQTPNSLNRGESAALRRSPPLCQIQPQPFASLKMTTAPRFQLQWPLNSDAILALTVCHQCCIPAGLMTVVSLSTTVFHACKPPLQLLITIRSSPHRQRFSLARLLVLFGETSNSDGIATPTLAAPLVTAPWVATRGH